MSSVVDPHPDQPAAEELVAYLDGELSPDECRCIEERLAADPNYRQQLRDLDQAWEALDALPNRKADDDFARTTMELVTIAASEDASTVTADAVRAKHRRTAWFAAAAIAGALLGFVAASLLLPNYNRALLNDLPVIHQVDVLRQVEDIEFVRRLADDVDLDRLNTDESALENEKKQLTLIGSESLDVRREWVEALPAEEKVLLAAQTERFRKLDDDEKERLRKLERDIDAGGDKLQDAFLAYSQWISKLTAAEQEEIRTDLRNQPVAEQIEIVEQRMRRQRHQTSRQLSAEDARRLREELQQIAEERKAEIAKELRERRESGRVGRFEGPRSVLAILARENDIRVWQRLVGVLSPEAQEHLNTLSGPRKPGQLWRWIGEALQLEVSADELERFFAEKLDNDDRERLLNLPPSDMQSQLRLMYYATELGIRDPAQWRNSFREWGRDPRERRDGAGFRPDDRGRPGGPPGGPPPRFDERRRGPDGPPGPRDGDFRDDRRRDRRGPGGPFPGGPPPDGPPPREPVEPIDEI
jgi:hypothetical protein